MQIISINKNSKKRRMIMRQEVRYGFPEDFLWGGATAANQIEALIRETAKVCPPQIMLPIKIPIQREK